MSMPISRRILALAALMLLAACDKSGPATTNALDPFGSGEAAADDRIECAIGGGQWARACSVERLQGADGLMLTIRHPDGGFRRLRVTTDGRGVISADGAESSTLNVIGPGKIEVIVAGDGYRLPATVKQ